MENRVSKGTDVQFELLFQAMPGQWVVLSPELVILAANDRYLTTTNKSRSGIVGQHLFVVFPPAKEQTGKGKDELLVSLNHVIKYKKPHTVPASHYSLSTGNGRDHLYWNLVNTPVLDQAGNLLYILHEVRDITHQVQEKQEVKTSQDSLRLMAKIVGGAVWEYDVLNKTFNWSESYKQLFGYSDEDLQVEPDDWSFRVHPDDIAHVRTTIDAAIQKRGKSWTGEYRYLKADGSYADVLDHGYILYDLAGNPVRMLGSMIDLTKQKEFERELQESNLRFELVAKATNDVIWDWDLLTNSIWWNDGFELLFGYENKEAVTPIETWMGHIHPEDAPSVEASIQQAINSEESWEGTYRFRCANGKYKIVNDKGYILRDESGLAIRMIGAMLDITEKHEIQMKLQESNNRTKQVLESLPLMTWTAEANGSVNYYSQSWYKYTGYTFEELRDWGWKDLLHPDDLENTLRAWQQALATSTSYDHASRWRAADGQYRWFLGRAVPLLDAFGNITSWVGSHTDIHDFQLLHRQLEESNKNFRFLAETIPQLIWTTDAAGNHEYFNQRWLDYTCLTQQESINLAWKDLLHPEDRARTVERWEHSLLTGEYYEMEFRFRNGRNGTYRWFLEQAMPMRDKQGAIVKWFGTCTDIEDHKRAEEELVEKNLELERINHDLDSFVYTASHDLKLPIVNMTGIFNELIQAAEFQDPEAPAMIHMFNKSLSQLHETIHDLSEVVRIQKEKDEELEYINLYELTEDIKLSIQDSVKASGARIIMDFEEAPAIPFTRSSLKSIFYNLISNAIKYRAPARVPEIVITSKQKGNFIELKIQDNGIGIDMTKHQSKVFQMFKRFHNHVAGSGLGLYIVNRLLSNHGGYIQLESEPDKGSTFYLYFKDTKQK